MTLRPRFASGISLACGSALAICSLLPQFADGQEVPQGLRAQAVVNLAFEEPSGDALDSAAAGTVKDIGQAQNGPVRVKSPFPGQKGKLAIVFDGGRKQFLQFADSADLDRPEAVSLNFFFLNLTSLEDAAAYGIVAKRDAGGANATNYGINYVGKNDIFQLYINDGSGFRVVQFSVKEAIGYRRPVFLTATFEVGDAPAPDADADKDDLLIRLYANGQPIVPKMAANGNIAGHDAWLHDVKVAGLLNDVPLTLGSSNPAIEFTSGVLDEFSLFPRALTPAEAKQLFLEVAGPDAVTAAQGTAPPRPGPPTLASLSQSGLQLGETTTLVITGSSLLPTPVLSLPVPIAAQIVSPNSNPQRLEVQLTLAANIPAGYYPLRVQTPHGLSNPLPIALDALPQVLAPAAASPDKPLTLPAAVSGRLSGAEQVRLFFAGQAGQRVVVDLESKRLGSGLTPVLEIKTARGTPLLIEWGKAEYQDDARAELKLPADGVYFAELHDLAYRAPGASPFRMKLGDLKLVDAVLPFGVTLGTQAEVGLVGVGLDAAARAPVDLRQLTLPIPQRIVLPETLGAAAPAPTVLAIEGIEATETPSAGGELQTVDARFTDKPHLPVFVSGRLAQEREQDRYLLQVTPGQKLSLALPARSIHSPLDPQLSILKHPEGNPLATANDPGGREPVLEFTVPAGVQAVQLAVKDTRHRGGSHYLYRVRIIPAGRPDFSLSLLADRVQFPADGRAALQVEVGRTGYNGPIKLSSSAGMTITPAELPAGITKAFITLSVPAGTAPASPDTLFQIVGEAAELNPPLRKLATIPLDARLTLIAGYRETVTASVSPPTGLALTQGQFPASLFRGVDVDLPLTLAATGNPPAKALRLSLQSTEAPRQNTPNDPSKGLKPRVDAGLNQSLEADGTPGVLRVNVPTDVAEGSIDFVIKGEVVENPYAQAVLGTLYSVPFRLPVQNAIALQPAANALNLVGGAPMKFAGTVKRTAGFTGPVEVLLVGFPAGYTAPKVILPPDQENFELVVTAPAVTAAADVPNITLRATSANGTPLLGDMPIGTKVAPPAK